MSEFKLKLLQIGFPSLGSIHEPNTIALQKGGSIASKRGNEEITLQYIIQAMNVVKICYSENGAII